ncbi:rhomboid family intramembrane serine protease [bacterium]|jgi:membrane associated rhomboid family serine protease|nr:rhomboid family intramembrane serine protease [bacterium]NBX72665.1 rhomboid family intramembrane serine protease [bacterium]
MQIFNFVENIKLYSENLFILISYVLVFNLINWIFLGSILNIFGIYPRKLLGSPGIVAAPILHGNFQHFVSNAIPFYWLSLLMIAIAGELDYYVILCIIGLISGLLIWLFARRAIHIGASALITGMYSWLVCYTIYEPSLLNGIILGILFLYFGFIVIGILPEESHVSWEGHLLGLIAGMMTYYYLYDLMNYYEEILIGITEIKIWMMRHMMF